MKRVRSRLGFILAAALLAAATLIVAAGNDISETPLLGALASWCAVLLIAAAATAAAPARVWIVPAGIAGLYVVACIALALFHIGEPLGLDADFVLAAPKDSAKTLVKIIGGPATAALVLAVVALVIAIAASLRALTSPLKTMPRRFALIAAIVAIPALAFFGLPHSHLRRPPHLRAGESIRPTAVKYGPLPRTNGESVFVLQLESVNGLIADPGYEIHGKPVPTDPLSGMRELARRGFFFPHFWGGAVSTHRAQETILCGAVRNLHAPYFDQLIPWDGKCLPALLRDAGYKTVFLSSFPDRAFGDTGQFMQRAGFDDIRFAGDLMKPGDPIARWGYEERAFYKRAFEYLRRRYKPDEPIFAYFVVCAHHYSFTHDAAKTDIQYLLGDELKKIEKYLESQRLQDQSLLVFDQLLREYKRGNAHALYVPDHSFPLGLYGGSAPSMGATIDNFITPLVYVPPDGRADLARGRTLQEMHAQTDLVPTILELVSDTPQSNSLAPFLRREPAARADYEQCHLMSQPYGGKWLFVARGTNAYQYHVSTETFREFHIGGNPLRQTLVREASMTYDEFERRYGCKRFPMR